MPPTIKVPPAIMNNGNPNPLPPLGPLSGVATTTSPWSLEESTGSGVLVEPSSDGGGSTTVVSPVRAVNASS